MDHAPSRPVQRPRSGSSRVSRVTAWLLLGLLGLSLLQPLPAGADLSGDLDDFLVSWEGRLRTTTPGFYQGQRRGFLTGGSADLRFPSRQPQLLTYSLPRVKAGCGGISFFGGALSYVNLQQFTQYLQAIAEQTAGMAFSMALQTLCPQCATVLHKLDAEIRKITSQLQSSCQTARTLLNTVGLNQQNLKEVAYQNCNAINSLLGETVSDWFGASEACKESGKIRDADSRATRAGLPRLSQNLFWKAYRTFKDGQPEWDDEFGEALMSLTGTLIISYADSDEGKLDSRDATLNATDLLLGWDSSEKTILRCGELTECLTVTPAPASAFTGLERRIYDRLIRYAEDLDTRAPSTALGSALLQTPVAGLPLVRLLSLTGSTPGRDELILRPAARIVSLRLLAHYLQVLKQLRAEVIRIEDASGAKRTFLEALDRKTQDLTTELDRHRREVTETSLHLQALLPLLSGPQGQQSSIWYTVRRAK